MANLIRINFQMEAQYNLLRDFTKCLKANPAILHDPKLSFFREYLERLDYFFVLFLLNF